MHGDVIRRWRAVFCYVSNVVLDLYVGIKTCLFTTGLYSLYDIQLYGDLSRQQHNRVNDSFYRLDCSFIFSSWLCLEGSRDL